MKVYLIWNGFNSVCDRVIYIIDNGNAITEDKLKQFLFLLDTKGKSIIFHQVYTSVFIPNACAQSWLYSSIDIEDIDELYNMYTATYKDELSGALYCTILRNREEVISNSGLSFDLDDNTIISKVVQNGDHLYYMKAARVLKDKLVNVIPEAISSVEMSYFIWDYMNKKVLGYSRDIEIIKGINNLIGRIEYGIFSLVMSEPNMELFYDMKQGFISKARCGNQVIRVDLSHEITKNSIAKWRLLK